MVTRHASGEGRRGSIIMKSMVPERLDNDYSWGAAGSRGCGECTYVVILSRYSSCDTPVS